MKRKGCLIAAVVVVVIVLIVAVVLVLNWERIMGAAMGKVGEQIMASLPPEYDVETVRQALEEFMEGYEDGRVDQEEIKDFMTLFQASMADKKLEVHEMDQLVEAMKAAVR